MRISLWTVSSKPNCVRWSLAVCISILHISTEVYNFFKKVRALDSRIHKTVESADRRYFKEFLDLDPNIVQRHALYVITKQVHIRSLHIRAWQFIPDSPCMSHFTLDFGIVCSAIHNMGFKVTKLSNHFSKYSRNSWNQNTKQKWNPFKKWKKILYVKKQKNSLVKK